MIRNGIRKILTRHRNCDRPQVTGLSSIFVIFSLVCGLVFVTPAAANPVSAIVNNVSLSPLVGPIFQNQFVQEIEESINDVGLLVGDLINRTSDAINVVVTDLGSTPEPVTVQRTTVSVPTQNTSNNGSLEAPPLKLEAPTNVISNTVSSSTVSIVDQKQLLAGNHQGTGNPESKENRLISFLTSGILTAGFSGGGGSSGSPSGSHQAGISADLTNPAQLPLMEFIDDTPDPDRLPPFIVLFSPPG